jgi:hypothetical protein
MSIWMFATIAAIAVLIVFTIRKKLIKTRVAAALIAGLGIADGALSGRLTVWLNDLARLATNGSDRLTAIALGVALPSLAVLVLALFVGHDLMPKHKAHVATTVMAFVLPFMAIAAGGNAAQVTHATFTSVQTTSQGG